MLNLLLLSRNKEDFTGFFMTLAGLYFHLLTLQKMYSVLKIERVLALDINEIEKIFGFTNPITVSRYGFG